MGTMSKTRSMPLMEGDEAGAGAGGCRGMLEGFTKRPRVFMRSRTDCHGPCGGVYVWHFGHGGDARRFQRIHNHHSRSGSAVPAPLAVEPINFTLRGSGGEIVFHVSRRRCAAKFTTPKHSLIEHSSISLWLKHATAFATLMSLRTLENGPYRVTMQLHASSDRNRLFGVTRANAFQFGCPNITFSAKF